MPMVSKIGRKSWKVRFFFGWIYILLTLGAVTMVYPFLLMISGSTKSAVDIKYFDAVPHFLVDELWLYHKHMEGLFNEEIDQLNYAYGEDLTVFEKTIPPIKINPAIVTEMETFFKDHYYSPFTYGNGYLETPISKTMPNNLRAFKEFLQKKYGDDINTVNEILGTEYLSWNSVFIGVKHFIVRRDKTFETVFNKNLNEFKGTLPLGTRYYYSPEGFYKKAYLMVVYGKDITDYNKSHGTDYPDYNSIHLSRRYPENKGLKEQQDWEEFVRNTIGLQYLQVDNSALPAYREYLKAKQLTIQNLNKNYNTNYRSFAEIPLMENNISQCMAGSDWSLFIEGWKPPDDNKIYKAPIKALEITCADFSFQDFLTIKYRSIEAVNTKLSTDYKSFADVLLPQKHLHYTYFQKHKNNIRWEFITRNYITVADYMLFHGRGILNTVIYCSLAILAALIVNPLAAYAMSRYQLPSSYKILLFLLCTMAFPPMITAIPSFLMLRHFNLLNTFYALVLPGLANGYAIFLLKGFFDSQPRELYESAQIDGASEWVIFWQITMSLSKPILAVIALHAFTMAYSDFMFAFIVCQDSEMWTMMVWLYQLQQKSGQAVTYASLIIAAIPTLIIFLFCQNIIMRGIVVPSEK